MPSLRKREMRLRRKKDEAGLEEVNEPTLTAIETDRCSNCGSQVEPEDAFCAACGSIFSPVLLESEGGASRVNEITKPPRRFGLGHLSRRRWLVAIVAAGVITLAALGGLTYGWLHERNQREDAQLALSAERARTAQLSDQIAELRTQLADTEAKLAAAETLSDARARVLAQTGKVLKRVDPLLSSVDELQSIAGEMQGGRTTFVDASDGFISEVIVFANYLITIADPYSADSQYVNSEINYLNSQLAEVNSAAGMLDSHDSDYADASRRFGNRADAYSSAVRSLQRSLAAVSK